MSAKVVSAVLFAMAAAMSFWPRSGGDYYFSVSFGAACVVMALVRLVDYAAEVFASGHLADKAATLPQEPGDIDPAVLHAGAAYRVTEGNLARSRAIGVSR